MRAPGTLGEGLRRTILRPQRDREGVMNNDVRNEPLGVEADSEEGPLRHFRLGRRVVLQSLMAGAGAAVFASRVSAAHAHHAATAPLSAAVGADSTLLFLDRHAFDTLAVLSEQIVPGA